MTDGTAVVIGASLAGLVAARALSDTFAEVVLVDRDALPARVENRRGVPQGKHLHGLLARGLQSLEELFPGFADEMVAAGALRGDLQSDLHWYVDGYQLKPVSSGLIGIASSRPLLESTVRARVERLPGVKVLDNHDVLSLLTGQRKVTGVVMRSRVDGAEPVEVEADLVVDASGRGSRTPIWLAEMGYAPPEETKMAVDTTYVTRAYEPKPGRPYGVLGVTVAAFPGSPRSGFLLKQENNRYVLTTGGVYGLRPPTDDAGLLEFAKALPTRAFTEFLSTATRVGEPVTMRYPASSRRYYEKLTEFPDGYLVVGDAVCSFNPVYGQGMTVAMAEGEILRDLLKDGRHELARRFFAEAAKLVETAWSVSSGGDLRFPESGTKLPPQARLLNHYLHRVYRVAAGDTTVATAFLRVINLIDSPDKMLAPAVFRRVFRRLPRASPAADRRA
ncbi:NAD(P)/FAD-dependent oxidoreductase [Amycolatopsis jiangsuensis]|uniref:2-polyprenyl-6-methoxyphenol hydroxylase-like FAD-dependent oxidoreductase n=1 Tax=Amycolatopsis jiangsuensis TaxID=1181879 RepID=A0A840IYW4_9PSEU|nr:FAD-dependent monooxygenase [Amycolatopsis jiangsuensis]MBB4686699.1 2-polyprenyl-6-methoxyphenol hydroxylase-like FAD-dependent oxidoreductase [Amycolatopsis jiangsuensis]